VWCGDTWMRRPGCAAAYVKTRALTSCWYKLHGLWLLPWSCCVFQRQTWSRPPIAIALFSGSFCTDVEGGFRLRHCRVFTKLWLSVFVETTLWPRKYFHSLVFFKIAELLVCVLQVLRQTSLLQVTGVCRKLRIILFLRKTLLYFRKCFYLWVIRWYLKHCCSVLYIVRGISLGRTQTVHKILS
jgi:hypothetical protein